MKDYESLMKSEIRERLESDSWNFFMATGVIKARNLRKEKSIFRGYVASLTAAAVFMVIFVFNIYSYMNTTAVNSSSSLYSYSSTTDTLSTEDIDLLINEAFPMR